MKSKNMLILAAIIAVAIILNLIAYFGIGSSKLLSAANIKQGLDLMGGISIVYEADAESPSADEMSSAVSMIRERLDRKNYTEAEVSAENNNRIRVEIPGIDDAETAVTEIGQTAMLTFTDSTGAIVLDGSDVADAKMTTNANQMGASEVVVLLSFTPDGVQKFSDATAANIGSPIYIMLDDAVISAPVVNERITDGNAVISGGFTAEEADNLAVLIRAGSLPFALKVVDYNNVGAKLGTDSLGSSLIAGAVGVAAVFIFMFVVYRTLGLAADLALAIYIGLEIIILSLFGVTLTLPGIAGIVLSVGMAVDANVIIFERIKEEIWSGKTLRASVKAGFTRAFPPILDGNVTTLIAAFVLFWLGTGPIKGFAQTLSLGIVISMFTALTVTRLILNTFVATGILSPKAYSKKQEVRI